MVKIKVKTVTIAIIQIYAPKAEHSDQDIDLFDDLDSAISQCKNREIVILMGDLNAKIGKREVDNLVGK